MLRVVTRCASRDDFVAAFDRFVDESSVFVATHQPRPIGSRLPFAFALKDGDAVLRGEGEVVESTLDATGSSMRRAGMRLRILKLDPATVEVHQALLERRRRLTTTIPPSSSSAQQPQVGPKPAGRVLAELAVSAIASPSILPHATPSPVPVPMPVQVTKRSASPPPTPLPVGPPPLPQAAVAPPAPVAAVAVAPAPSIHEPAPGEGTNPGESRVPGSSIVVPANPFGEIQPEALESFIECTIYEETAVLPPDEFGMATPSVSVFRSGPSVNMFTSTPSVNLFGASPSVSLLTHGLSASQPLAPAVPAASAPPVTASAAPVPAPPAPAPAAAPVQPSPATPPRGAPAVYAAPPVPAEVVVRRSGASPWVAVLGGILGAGLGLAGGYALWASQATRGAVSAVARDPAGPAATAQAPAAAPTPVAAVAPTVEPLGRAEAETADPAPAPEAEAAPSPPAAAAPEAAPAAAATASADPEPGPRDEAKAEDPDPSPKAAEEKTTAAVAVATSPPEPAARRGSRSSDDGPDLAPNACGLTVKTEPPGARVHGAGFKSRTTPATFEAPCGPVQLTIDHPRYMRVERSVSLSAGDRESVYERLERPGAVLTLRSTPAGATFVVNGRDVGRAPTRAAVNAFTTVTVKAVLDGYGSVVQRYYVRGTSATFEAYLDGSGRTATRASRSALRRRPKPEL